MEKKHEMMSLEDSEQLKGRMKFFFSIIFSSFPHCILKNTDTVKIGYIFVISVRVWHTFVFTWLIILQ